MSDLRERIRFSNTKEYPQWIGQMKICELLGIAVVAKEIAAEAYVVFGCGSGADILSISMNYKEIPTLAFDWKDIDLSIKHSLVEFHKEDLFENPIIYNPIFKYEPNFHFRPQIHNIIKTFVDKIKGPILFYTDNGKKLAELNEILRYLRPKDVIGTHDYTTEVPESECGFIYESGCETYESFGAWAKNNPCLQKFWIKK